MRLNKQYRAEASVLEMSRTERPDLARYTRHRVFVFVDAIDLAEIEAMRYGNGLHADELTAVHFVTGRDHAPTDCSSAGIASNTTPSYGWSTARTAT